MSLQMDKLTPKQAADFLKIGSEVLKKYAILLEHNGHTIGRNGMNHRYYTEEDLTLIKAMIILNREKSVTLEQAASIVTSSNIDIEAVIGDSVINNTNNNKVQTVITAQITDELQAVRTFLAKQEHENESLRKRIHEHDKMLLEFHMRLTAKLEKQGNLISQQSNQIRELKKELYEVKEQPKSIWARILGK